MEEEGLFIAEKLAYRPESYLWSWQTNPDSSQLAEEMAFVGLLHIPERKPFGFGNSLGTFLKYLHSVI